MAVRHIEQLICDYCGVVQEEDAEVKRNVTFSLGRDTRELDLCASCMSDVEDLMAPLFAVSRPTTAEVQRRVLGPKGKSTGKPSPLKGRHYPEEECPICHRKFKGKQGMANHRIQAHSNLSGPQKCDTCDREFGGIMGLRGHMSRTGHASHQGKIGQPIGEVIVLPPTPAATTPRRARVKA